MDREEEFEDREQLEVATRQLFEAAGRNLNAVSTALVALLDQEAEDTSGLFDAYLAWSAMMAIVGGIARAHLSASGSQDLDDIPGFRTVAEQGAELNKAVKAFLSEPEDRELLLEAAACWMSVRDGSEQLLQHLSESF